MKVIFCRSNSITSLFIRLMTWSRWHHCGVIHDGYVIHATASKGVVKESLQDVKKRYTYEIRAMRGDASKALSLIGCKYDWGGVFGHWFGFFDKKNKWFCSELLAFCSSDFIQDRKSRVTPEHCYMISKEIKE